jgi:hypothetical protein
MSLLLIDGWARRGIWRAGGSLIVTTGKRCASVCSISDEKHDSICLRIPDILVAVLRTRAPRAGHHGCCAAALYIIQRDLTCSSKALDISG